MFYAKEKGWIQKEVLPAIAIESMGSLLPLLITPIKYNYLNLYAFSQSEPYNDELKSLHVNAPNLKQYIGKNIIDIENKINFYRNEHFSTISGSEIIAYDDVENNLVLILKNFIKFKKI